MTVRSVVSPRLSGSLSHFTMPTSVRGSACAFAMVFAFACGGDKNDAGAGTTTMMTSSTTTQDQGQGGTASLTTSGGGGSITIATTGGTGGASGSGGGMMVTLPADKWITTEVGGYQMGPAVTGAGITDTGLGAGAEGCNTMVGVVRDFKGQKEQGGHPDFEAYYWGSPTERLVAVDLGVDGKPVYTGRCQAPNPDKTACPFGPQTSTKAAFDQWYRYAEGVNKPYLVYFMLSPNGKISTFDSKYFFPVDGQGFGNSGTGEDGKMHNFGFTTELHTNFTYNGGETFKFVGDDDLWVFINGKLVIDLGGVHPSEPGSIDLDTLGLTKGQVYRLELFHAERFTQASHFHIDTTLAFVDCGVVPPDVN